MPAPFPRTHGERTVSAGGVAILHLALGYLLLAGLGVELPRRSEHALSLFDAPAPPPPPAEPTRRPTARTEPKGRAAPPAPLAAPKPVVAPPPPIPLPPTPVAAAPVAMQDFGTSAGAALTPGPGTGAGGSGDGLGGGRGNGAGGPALARRARRISGELRNADYPRAAVRVRAQGDVIAHLLIDAEGLVAACRVARSSGSADLDATTCRLIRERFRYRPALDTEGRPVPDELGWRQSWWLDR